MAWIRKYRRINKGTRRRENYYVISWIDDQGSESSHSLGFCGAAEAKRQLAVVEGRLADGLSAWPLEEEAKPTPEPQALPVTSQPTPPLPLAPTLDPPPIAPTLWEYFYNCFLPVVERDKAKKTADQARNSAVALCRFMGDKRIDEITYSLADQFITALPNDNYSSPLTTTISPHPPTGQ